MTLPHRGGWFEHGANVSGVGGAMYRDRRRAGVRLCWEVAIPEMTYGVVQLYYGLGVGLVTKSLPKGTQCWIK